MTDHLTNQHIPQHNREVPARRVGVLKYSGKATDVMTREKLTSLAAMLAQESLIDAAKVSTVVYQYCMPAQPRPRNPNNYYHDNGPLSP